VGEAIEPPDIALTIVRTHQSMNASHLAESPTDSLCELRLRQSSRDNFHQGPE